MRRGAKQDLIILRPVFENKETSPCFSGVSAGFPSPADGEMEEELDLNAYLVKNRAATFYVKVVGDSMIGAGIYPGDLLIVDRSQEVFSGQVIIAVLEGEFLCKRFQKEGSRAYLLAENPNYDIIDIGEYSDFQVWGVVEWVLHQPKLY